jgi:hypothetical protein
MKLIKSRFNQKIIFYLVASFLASFLISLALLQLFAALLFLMWLFEKDKLKATDSFFYIMIGFGLVRLTSIFFSEFFNSSLIAVQKELLFYTTLAALFFYLKTLSRENISKQFFQWVKVTVHNLSAQVMQHFQLIWQLC